MAVYRWRFLLGLITKKELRVRYRGSVLGMVWSYIKPAVQLVVYFVAMGHFIGMGRAIPNYVIYLFSGMVMINFFTEIVLNATRSIIENAPLVGKIYMPRELFPVSSLQVAAFHMVPQVVVLWVGALFTGWRPTLTSLVSILASIALVSIFGLGTGLLLSTFNVFYRDAQNLVELFNMVSIWLSPVFYSWVFVANAVPRWLFYLYELNPLTVAVQLAHDGFWASTLSSNPDAAALTAWPDHWGVILGASAGLSLVLLLLGQAVFSRWQGHFGEEI